MNYEKSARKQNLFLFFEDNEDDRSISNNMVKLYMNCFLINEDCQHELMGIHNLTKVKIKPRNYLDQVLFKFPQIRKKRLEQINNDKIKRDKLILHDVFKKAAGLRPLPYDYRSGSVDLYDSHFIIATSELNGDLRRWILSWQRFHASYNIVMCTQLVGHHTQLATKLPYHYFRTPRPNILENLREVIGHWAVMDVPGTSINDDAEYLAKRVTYQYYFDLLRNDYYSKLCWCRLSLNRMITKSERQAIKYFKVQNNFEIIACLSNNGPLIDKSFECEKIHRAPDIKYQYLQCECARYTFIL